MSEYDSLSNCEILGGIAATGFSGGATVLSNNVTGPIIDTAGFNALEILMDVDNSSNSWQMDIEHADDGVTWEPVPAELIVGTAATVVEDGRLHNLIAGDAFQQRFGLLSKKRYFRFVQDGTATNTGLVCIVGFHPIKGETSPNIFGATP